jgi:hypothetical protein
MNQLGRLPLRVFSIGKDAFQKFQKFGKKMAALGSAGRLLNLVRARGLGSYELLSYSLLTCYCACAWLQSVACSSSSVCLRPIAYATGSTSTSTCTAIESHKAAWATSEVSTAVNLATLEY